MASENTTMTIRVPRTMKSQLQEFAERLNTNASGVIRDLVDAHLEDFIDARDADKILEKLASGKTQTVAWSEVRDELED